MNATRPNGIVLLLGPSGIGKSTAMESAKRIVLKTAFVDLDQLAENRGRMQGLIGPGESAEKLLVSKGPNAFLQFGIDAASEFTARAVEHAVVIDVGAGFLAADQIGAWLNQHASVAFMSPMPVAYERMKLRRPSDPRRFGDYVAQEFSAARKKLYESTTYQINADCSAEELGQRLIRLLLGLVTSS
jgi:shikimate kinase